MHTFDMKHKHKLCLVLFDVHVDVCSHGQQNKNVFFVFFDFLLVLVQSFDKHKIIFRTQKR